MHQVNKKIILTIIVMVLCVQRSEAFNVLPAEPLFTIQHDFLQPSDVAVGQSNNVYVLDGVNHKVKVFSDSGTFLFAFGSHGTQPGQFKAPVGIEIDQKGTVYVADSGNRRVQLFTPAGAFKRQIAVTSADNEASADPVDVAVDDRRNRIYITDNENHRVNVYDLQSFDFIESWGSEGEDRFSFKYPFFITVGTDTSVFVVDVVNTRVQVWSPNGKPVGTIGGWGVDVGQFYRPKGVCIDAENYIYVSDSYLGAIQIFNRYGHLRAVVGNDDGTALLLKTPVGIAVDAKKRLYVVEMIKNRVGVYQLSSERILGKQ